MSLDFSLRENGELVFDANITHNLNTMADKAGIYQVLWRPEEINVTIAKQVIGILMTNYLHLYENPEYYKEFEPDNGWGKHENLVDFTKRVLIACIEYPNATIEISR